MTMWTFQEYCNATNSWGVRAIQLSRAATGAAGRRVAAERRARAQSSVDVTITGSSSAGSGFFDPGADTGGPGFPKHLTASVSDGVTVNSVTFIDPTHVTLNLSTLCTAPGAKDVTRDQPGRSEQHRHRGAHGHRLGARHMRTAGAVQSMRARWRPQEHRLLHGVGAESGADPHARSHPEEDADLLRRRSAVRHRRRARQQQLYDADPLVHQQQRSALAAACRRDVATLRGHAPRATSTNAANQANRQTLEASGRRRRLRRRVCTAARRRSSSARRTPDRAPAARCSPSRCRSASVKGKIYVGRRTLRVKVTDALPATRIRIR